jgi:hypothetical protein
MPDEPLKPTISNVHVATPSPPTPKKPVIKIETNQSRSAFKATEEMEAYIKG